jgi:hypothetical protein
MFPARLRGTLSAVALASALATTMSAGRAADAVSGLPRSAVEPKRAAEAETSPETRQQFERFLTETSKRPHPDRPDPDRPDPDRPVAAGQDDEIGPDLRKTFERFLDDRNRAAEERARKTIAVFFRERSGAAPAEPERPVAGSQPQADPWGNSALDALPAKRDGASAAPSALTLPAAAENPATAAQDRTTPSADRDHAADRAILETQVRQGGNAADAGLLKKLQGPGARVNTLTKNTALAVESGAAKEGPDYRRYLYSAASTSLGGIETRLEAIGDENGGGAGELQLKKKMGDVSFNYAALRNDRFESDETGSGKQLARSFNQVGADWYVEPALLGLAVRETARVDGETVRELRSYQAVALGPVYLSHSTATPAGGGGALGTFGTISLSSYSESAGYYADFSYGDGKRLNPTGLSAGFDAYDVGGWALSASSSVSFDGSYGGVAVSMVKELGGVRFGPAVGVDNAANGYAMLRASLPLNAGTSPLNWLADGERLRPRSANPVDEWCRTTTVCH